MSETGFKDHFSARAAGYAAFRPRYPDALFAWFASLAPSRRLAWDAGTGNGQAATALAEYFDAVVATDASDAQIANATPHPKVRYAVRRERESGLDDRSCDLATVAQALHWFDVPAYFTEARRVLRPRGVCAVWTYARPAFDDARVDAILQEYTDLMTPWWPGERAMVESGYRTIAFPFEEIATPAMELELHVVRDECVGYMRTWSSHTRYVEAGHADPVVDVERRFMAIWPDGVHHRLHWPLHVRAGRTI